ncbi:hypothetical protein BKA14_005838 [Actinoplanes abujensis]|uniref:Uncharacterized protein n=1 Tax=Paractinoplanes abujensis TaxID=882441 RepID=A0A7W7CY54_9ACTN|nr:hypothetical protein [Actinoplanes abujensis]
MTHRRISLTERIDTTPEGVVDQLPRKRLTALSFFQVHRRSRHAIMKPSLGGANHATPTKGRKSNSRRRQMRTRQRANRSLTQNPGQISRRSATRPGVSHAGHKRAHRHATRATGDSPPPRDAHRPRHGAPPPVRRTAARPAPRTPATPLSPGPNPANPLWTTRLPASSGAAISIPLGRPGGPYGFRQAARARLLRVCAGKKSRRETPSSCRRSRRRHPARRQHPGSCVRQGQ